MIVSLRGTVIDITAHHAVIECAGVGYQVLATPTTLGKELAVFAHRLTRQARRVEGDEILGVVPCNDGGLALGQAVIAAARLAHEGSGECA